MILLKRIYLVLCLVVTGWFGTAAYQGWKTTPIFPAEGPARATHSPGGVYWHTGGGFRTSGGSWGGGK